MVKELKKRQKLRKTLLYLWLVVMPITFNWMSPVLIIMAGFEATINMSIIVFTTWFVSSLIFGRAYCAYACQWGALQEVYGESLRKKLNPEKKKKRRKWKYPIFVIWMIFIILGPILAGGYINGFKWWYPNPDTDRDITSFDPEPIAWIFYFGIQILIALWFTLRSGSRGFCNYYCPMGVIGIIGTKIKNKLKYPSLHLESNKQKCTQCKLCSRECPMSLDVHEMVYQHKMENNDCILCGSCVDNCPRKVIEFKWKWEKR